MSVLHGCGRGGGIDESEEGCCASDETYHSPSITF